MVDPRQQAVDRVRLANVVKRRSFLDRLGFAAAGIRGAWRLVQPIRHCPYFGQNTDSRGLTGSTGPSVNLIALWTRICSATDPPRTPLTGADGPVCSRDGNTGLSRPRPRGTG